MRAIVTVIGKDHVGIIAKVSGYFSETKINILDISQTIMQEYFVMIMLVDTSSCSHTIDKVSRELDAIGVPNGLSIRIQNEDIFNAMHKI